jgi:hypothetical protein
MSRPWSHVAAAAAGTTRRKPGELGGKNVGQASPTIAALKPKSPCPRSEAFHPRARAIAVAVATPSRAPSAAAGEKSAKARRNQAPAAGDAA